MRSYRYYIFLMCCAGLACPQAGAQSLSLTVERQGNYLHVAAPQLHFLAGKPLEQLHNGSAVTYVFDLTINAIGASPFSQHERFILSYDLWEEKFSIVQSGASGRSASHLTAEAAETWCLDNLLVPLPQLGPEKAFTARLECSITDDAESSPESGSGLTLAGLIDIFSRMKHEALPRWEAVSGPIRLGDLKDKKQKGSRISRRKPAG